MKCREVWEAGTQARGAVEGDREGQEEVRLGTRMETDG